MKKLMYIIHGFSMGGAETLIKEYCLRIDQEKFDLVVLCINHHNEAPYEGILLDRGIRMVFVEDLFTIKPKRNLLDKLNNYISIYRGIKKIVNEEQPDIIHANLSVLDFLKYAKPSLDTKIIYTVHSMPEALWLSNKKGKRELKAAKYLRTKYNMKFIAINRKMQKQINEMFSINDTALVNNGIDFDKFIIKESKSDIRIDIGIPKSAYVVGCVGRFSGVKNHTYLIDIFKSISDKNENARLLLVGTGNLRSEIENKLENYGLLNKTVIFENRLDVPRLMSCMDVFVLPSKYEGLSIVTIEAQKMGIPCFVSTGIPEDVVISNYVKRISLDETPDAWSKYILESTFKEIEYYDLDKWDMKNIINELENIYFER